MPDRRLFLATSGMAATWCALSPLAAAATPGTRRRSLVVLLQRGANDGLNTVVPFGDASYRALRPALAIAAPRSGDEQASLDLDGFFGLHPALAPLLPRWRSGQLALVHATGSPDPTRSHFDAQDYMESGTPGLKSTSDGWMNRALQARSAPEATPFRGVSLTATLPRALAGEARAVAMPDPSRFGLRPGARALAPGFEAMYGAGDEVSRSGRDAFDAMQFLSERLQRVPAAGPGYPRGSDVPPLAEVARLIAADVGLELAFCEMGGWDHHANQGGARGQHANRLRALGSALAAFADDLGERLDDVVVVVLTEFGRTARQNGNLGTDHGHGSCALVLGGGVRGGRVLGRWPGLERERLYEGRDLAVTTDFRDIAAELLERHLGVTRIEGVFPGHRSGSALGLLRG